MQVIVFYCLQNLLLIEQVYHLEIYILNVAFISGS